MIYRGSDALYLGTKNFNAKMSANNLSFYDIEVLNDFPRKKQYVYLMEK